MDVRPSANEFYTDDAAKLASEAARRRVAPKVAPRIRLPEGPVIFTGRERPPLRPDAPSNQNLRIDPPPRNGGLVRRFAWMILLPWYVVMLAASIAIIGLVVRLAAHI